MYMNNKCPFVIRKLLTSVSSLLIRRKYSVKIIKRDLKKKVFNDMTEDQKFNTVIEGKAEILQPASVFYNPVQEFNRDLTINVISEYVKDYLKNCQEQKEKLSRKRNFEHSQENSVSGSENEVNKEEIKPDLDYAKFKAGNRYESGISILEGLAASGLRSIRFGLEIPGVKKVVVNDFDKNAVEIIKKNISKNKLEDLLEAHCGDAAMVMYQNRTPEERFDVIDLDPYGSPAAFLDSAVQSVSDGGLLCVTATDMALLCGNTPEVCYAKYGSVCLKLKSCHEMALRILLQSIESHANRYSRYIVPLISISADFYIRVFVKIYTSAAKMKESASKMAMVHHCTGCGMYSLQRIAQKIDTKGGNFKTVPGASFIVPEKCEHCGHRHTMGGPIWADPIHDRDFLQRVIDRVDKTDQFTTASRIKGMLTLAMEEEPDCPLYYVTDDLCQVIHCRPMTLINLRSALLNAGFKVSCSHAAKNACKTNATNREIWDIFREWVKENPVSQKRLTPGSVAKAILDQEQKLQVSFKDHPDANPLSRKQGLTRWQMNPTKNWGPGTRAKRTSETPSQTQKAKRLQNKKQKRKEEADDGKLQEAENSEMTD